VRLGVRYSPEWDLEDRASEDADLMKRAGLNAACVGPTMWDRIEPDQGRYTFDWLDGVVKALTKQNLSVFLCLPVNAPPPWAITKYPEVGITDAHGQTASIGGPLCYNSTSLATLSQEITRALAERYGQKEAVAGWRIESPPGAPVPMHCYCETCEQAFRDWLIVQYQTEDSLSAAWGIAFRAWTEISLPRRNTIHPSHALDFARFQSQARTTFYDALRNTLLENVSDQEIICDIELTAKESDTDHTTFATETDPRMSHWIETSMGAETARPMSERYTVAEAPGSERRADPSAGALRRWIWQGVANGADRVYCGCWHTPRSGLAMGTNGLLSVDGRSSTAYKEVRRTADELTKVLPKLKGTRVEPKTAMLIQHDAHLAIDNPGTLPDPGSEKAYRHWYEAIKRIGHGCDIIAPGDSLDAYKLILAPWLPFVDDALADQLETYVKGGGRLVFGPGSGTRTHHNTLRTVTAPGPLLPLVGATVEESIIADVTDPMTINFARGALIAQRVEVSGRVDVLDQMSSQAYGEYVEGRFAGKAAITRYDVEKGEVHYIGAHLPGDTLYAFFDEVAPDYPMKKIPAGVEVTQRRGKKQRIVFILNHTTERQTITLPKACLDLITDKKIGPEVTLAANGVLILRS
jgi:beta-galactosidase